MLAVTAPEYTMSSSSLDHCCQPPHHVATGETHVHITLMQKPRKTDTAARAGHQHHLLPREFILLT